jgi:5'(3')-deoxyribonucleotidase
MIYLDMDGPLVNFNQGFLDLLPSTIGVTHDDLDQWDIWKCLGMTHQQMWDLINCGGSAWWRNLKPYPWAMDLYNGLKEIDNVTILTNPSWSSDACKGKLLWLHDRFGLEFEDWIFTCKKEYLARPGDILIDDHPLNCRKFKQHGGLSLLFPLPWNANEADGLFRPSKVESVVGHVKGLLSG